MMHDSIRHAIKAKQCRSFNNICLFEAMIPIIAMQANPDILQMKYARIVKLFAEQAGISYEEALGKFYDSETYELISEGVADMHCFSDDYLADELLLEYGYPINDEN